MLIKHGGFKIPTESEMPNPAFGINFLIGAVVIICGFAGIIMLVLAFTIDKALSGYSPTDLLTVKIIYLIISGLLFFASGMTYYFWSRKK